MQHRAQVLLWMTLFLGLVAGVCWLFQGPLMQAFLSNVAFNGMILGVLLVGILVNYRQVLILGPEVRWIGAFRNAGGSAGPLPLPRTRLLGMLARQLERERSERFSLSAMSLRTLLDGIRARLDESRDLSRYFMGLLVFLGLLGTFWGLLDTLRGVGSVISGLSIESGDAATTFESLKTGLEQPLSGMGTAFSSSLFGLAGALVLGFLDLQAGHAQNRFYNDLEEWLASQTKLAGGAFGGDGEGSVPAYIQALLEQTADSLDKLQRIMARGEEERRGADQRLLQLTEEVASLAEQSRTEQKGVMGLTRTQAELKGVLERLADSQGSDADYREHVREHLRQTANGIGYLRAELQADRERLVEELRQELRLLIRTMARIANGERPEE
ncbi:MAG TPA: hypothetical protein VJ947_06950 [Pseudohaliea sp.]|nr:hypothetical protein [Pseudohaliea sp.]